MKFNKYNSLTNAYVTSDIEKMRELVPSDKIWYVTEKIHGANFQFHMEIEDSERVFRLGKRTSYTDENFFGLHASEKFINEQVLVELMMNKMMDGDPDITSITLYGEVYGGNIQKGIFYSDFKRFIAFEMVVNDEILDYNSMRGMLDYYGVSYVGPLKIGTMDECLGYPNEFDSTIPESIGEGHREDNVCEGVVIRPLTPYTLSSGSAVIIKNKNNKWSEKSRIPKRNKQEELSEDDLKIYNSLCSYVNENRIAAAISKFGREMKYIPDILNEVKLDINLECIHDNPSFSSKDVIRITKGLNKRIVDLIKKDIMSG